MIEPKQKPKRSHLLSVAMLCTNILHGPPPPSVPTQTQVAKQGVAAYFKSLPKHAYDHLVNFAGMGDFELLKHEAEQGNSAFTMFNFAQERRIPSKEWSFNFGASDHSGFKKVVKVEQGLCADFTVTLRKMNMLAFYDPKNIENQLVPSSKQEPEAWLDFMKSKIDDIMNLKMTIIPGFKNLRQFSTNPKIAHYLRTKIVSEWQATNINVYQGGIQAILGTRQKNFTATGAAKLHQHLKERLDLGYNPTVFLIQESEKLFTPDHWIHVLQVNGIEEMNADGSYVMRVWDINMKAPIYADEVAIMKADGTVSYQGRQLGNVVPLKWDDLEVSKMIKNNITFCAQRPDLCKSRESRTITQYKPDKASYFLPTD